MSPADKRTPNHSGGGVPVFEMKATTLVKILEQVYFKTEIRENGRHCVIRVQDLVIASAWSCTAGLYAFNVAGIGMKSVRYCDPQVSSSS